MTTKRLKFKYADVVQDANGAAKINAAVTVYETGTTTLVSLYEDDEITDKANPTRTNITGEFSFVILPGTYDIKVVYGTTTKTFSKVVINGGLEVILSTDAATGTPAMDGSIWWQYAP